MSYLIQYIQVGPLLAIVLAMGKPSWVGMGALAQVGGHINIMISPQLIIK